MERLVALGRYDILDTLAETEFDDLTRLASNICGTPIALISLVDAGRQWFKSKVGIDASETARDISFCGHAILGQELFEVPNALEDERFRDNPLVAGAPDIRFYAGMPLVTADGYSVGTLCVIDRVSRHLTPQQREALIVLARQVVRQIENRLLAREREQAQLQRDQFFSLSLDLLCIAGMDGYFKRVNPAFSETLGYSTEEILARPFLDFVHQEDRAATLAEMDKLGHGEPTLQFENRYQCKDGSWKWLSWKTRPFPSEGLLYATARDITERKQADAKLLAANRFLDSVIENIPNMIFVKDAADLRFVRFNRAGQELLGYSQADLLGKNDYDLVPKEQADFFTRKDREVLASGKVLDIPEEPMHTRNKGERLLHTKKLPILDEHGRPRYLLGICQDVTEQKEKEREILRLNAALEKRAAEVEAANRAKSTFLATMSHEIRTPMNGVLGMVELLALTRLDAEQRTTLEIVRESGRSLLRIIDDILDFSRIEAGRLEVRPEAASIKEVIEGVFNIYSGNASSKGLLLKPVVDPQISPAVWVDPGRLRQILSNFVSNAIKFTSEGIIEIKADLIERVDAEDRVRFSVKDTGIGISPENQQQLFQPFRQADGEITRRYGGTGLGLTICRRLADLMGGSIEMVSELGKGTTIILTLSLPIADPQDLPEAEPEVTRDLLSSTTRMRRLAPSVAQAETEGTLVLLVDDHPTNRLLLVRQVKTLGYAAESAQNGVDALDKLQSGRFKMVITDCNMPEMDGYELARSIRRHESANGAGRIPIIACTANALGGEAETCFAAGMDDYLAKPVELTQLLTKLDQWLPIPEADAAPSEQSRIHSDPPAPGAAAPVDRSVLAEISGGDAAAERDILLDFRRVNDEDAAMLKQAVTNSDIPQVTRASHRIKGACKMVGAMELASVCEHIEHASRANDWNTIQVYMGAFHQEWMRLNAYLDSM
jgi:PAS domain S-box-containing protein